MTSNKKIPEFTLKTPGVLPCDAKEIAQALESNGAIILRKFLDPYHTQNLKEALVQTLNEDLALPRANYVSMGMALALVSRHEQFVQLLGYKPILEIARAVLGHGCIVHAYNSSSMPPADTNYSRTIHVDAPRLIPDYITNIGVTMAIDPFTAANGAMEIAPSLRDRMKAPSEEEFEKEKIVLDHLDAGDTIIFNARCWHRGGINTTPAWRHAVTMNLCRSFMRQQFDFPALLGTEKMELLSDDIKQFLGYFVRMPKNSQEFLMPANQRPYRPGQE